MIDYLNENLIESDEVQFFNFNKWLLKVSYYNIIDVTRLNLTDVAKSNNGEEYVLFRYWFFNHKFKFQNFVFNGCHDLMMLYVNFSDIAIITVKGVDYCIIQALANLKQFIYWKVMCLMIVDIYKKCISKRSILKIESTTII